MKQEIDQAETAFINLDDWEECGSTRTLEDFRGHSAVCGLDLSSGGDLTSLVLEIPYMDKNTEYIVKFDKNLGRNRFYGRL